MSKFLSIMAVIAVIAAALALFEPQLYNSLLDALAHFIGWIRKG